VRWTAPESMHVTLVFLGEVDERDLNAVCRVVKAVARREPPFVVRASGVGAFPNARRPKTLWAGITEGAENLQRLTAMLETELQALGCYRQENRAYTPHLTLGRVKADSAGHAIAAEFPKLMTWNGGQFAVEELLVYASDLTRDGPEYTVMGRGPLQGPAAS
jgi:2'-5' RNA ligase